MAAKAIDQYANMAAVNPTEGVAGTANYVKFAFPFSIMDKMGLIINRIEYYFNSLNQLNSSSDYIAMALTVAQGVADLTTQNDPLIVDSITKQRVDLGAAASGFFVDKPIVRDLSTLPAGGLLVAPNPLYGVIVSSGAAGVTSGWVKLFYTYIEMAADEFWQLVESRRIISS